jgi:hypothetical protein
MNRVTLSFDAIRSILSLDYAHTKAWDCNGMVIFSYHTGESRYPDMLIISRHRFVFGNSLSINFVFHYCLLA